MNKKTKLLSLTIGAVSTIQVFSPLAAYAAGQNGHNANSVNPEINENFIVPGVNAQNVNQLNEYGYSPLHLQVQEDNVGAVESLIALGADISLRDKNGDTPLHTAAREDAIACLVYLISKGADIEAKNQYGETPLMLSAKEGSSLSFSALLGEWLKERKADINAVDNNNNTVLHCLTGSGINNLRDILSIPEGPNSNEDNFSPLYKMVNRTNNVGETPIFNAIRSKDESIAMLLIKNGALNISNNDGQTPLMLAAQNGLKNLVRKFVELGANVEDTDRTGNTLLHYMAHNWDSSLNEIFNQQNKTIKNINLPFFKLYDMANVVNLQGETPLFVAAENNQSELADILIKNGAQVNLRNNDNKSPLHMATKTDSLEVADLLIKKGANADFTTDDYFTLLKIASKNNSVNVAKLLINNWNLPTDYMMNTYGNELLYSSSKHNSVDMARLLIENGVDPSRFKTDRDETLLHIAAKHNSVDVAKMLIEECGLDIEAKATYGGTPLYLAAARHSTDVVKLLIDNNANVNSEATCGLTPLLVVAFEENDENWEVAKLLLDNGANIAKCTDDGRTPLHNAVENGCYKITEILIKYGADVNIEDSEGIKPIDLATDPQIIALLRRVG